MNDIQVQHYLNAIEALLQQWDEFMIDTVDTFVRNERHWLPARRIRVLRTDILKRLPPPSCIRLRTDLARMIDAHSDVLYWTSIEHIAMDAAHGEYEEARNTIHAEVLRMRARYGA